jgi:hypothetical protein
MNARQFTAAVIAAASAAGAAWAIGATRFVDTTPSARIRAEVRAELEQARLDGTPMSGGEATVFVDRPVAAARTHVFDGPYVGAI